MDKLQLLQHKTTPGNYQLDIKDATITYSKDTPNLTITREKGSFEINSTFAKLNIDTFEARASIVPTTFMSIKQSTDDAKKHAEEVLERYAKEAQMLLKAKIGEPAFAQIDQQRSTVPTGEFALAFLPNVRPNIQYEPPSLDMKYQQDQLHIAFKVQKGEFNYTPGNVDLIIKQAPDLEIRYLGKPIYVPLDYEPTILFDQKA